MAGPADRGGQPVREALRARLYLPLIVAPMFRVSTPSLVIEACHGGAIGAFPSINARTPELFEQWIDEIGGALGSDGSSAPYAVNLLMHASNVRFTPDLEIVKRRRCPIVIASVGKPEAVLDEVHAYGGLVFADVVSLRHAHRAAAAGVDGLVLLCAGAGGQTGRLNPFAFVEAVRQFYDGLVVVAGGITRGHHLRALEELGADLGYCGTRFLTATESSAPPAHRAGVIEATIDDVWDTDAITGIPTNVLRSTLVSLGLTPETRWVQQKKSQYEWDAAKIRKDIFSLGHGAGDVVAEEPCRKILDRLAAEYHEGQSPTRNS
jgi:nitronate monooxygenase